MEELANIGFSTFISASSWYPVILGPRQIFNLCEVGVNPRVLRLVYNWYETGPYYLKSLPVWYKGWYCLRWYQIGMFFHTSRHTNTIYPCSFLYTTTNTPNVYYSRPSVSTQFTHWYAWQYLPDFVFFLGRPSNGRCTWPHIQGLISAFKVRV